jgi:predicted MFS family arabinose efflux permease
VAIDISGGRRAGAVMGWYTASLSGGYAVGAFAAGAVADRASVELALLWLGLLPLVAMGAVVLTPALADVARAPAAPGGWWHRGFSAFTTVDARVWLAFTIVLFLNVLSDSTDTFFPLYGTAIGLPVILIGTLKGARSASATVIRFVAGAIFRYVDFHRINFWAVVLFAATTFVIPLIAGPLAGSVLLAVFLIAGLCRGILRVTTAATIAEIRREGRDIGLSSGLYNAGLDLGSIIGPAAGGVVSTAFGIPTMFEVLAIASLVLYFGVSLSTPKGRGTLAPVFRPKVPAER